MLLGRVAGGFARMRDRAPLLLLALVGACGGSCDPVACELDGSGVPAGNLEAELVYQDVNGQVATVVDGGDILMTPAPQGGIIALVGVRVRGIEGCALTVNAALRDPCTNRVIALEERPVDLVDRGDGWGEPSSPSSLANFANIGACPSAALGHDLVDNPTILEVRVSDSTGAVRATLSANVIPRCLSDYCRCECSLNSSTCIGGPDAAPPGCPDEGSLDAGEPDASFVDAPS